MEPTDVATPTGAPAEVKTPEQVVADILPIETDPPSAQRVLEEVPFWFHTFALNDGDCYFARTVGRRSIEGNRGDWIPAKPALRPLR